MNHFTTYHLHSDESLLDSTTKFEEYVDLAVSQGATAIASTEHGKPMSWVRKKLYCDEHGIKFIHGVEIYLTEQLEPKVRDNYHTVLLAKNYDGVVELNRLVTKSCDKEHFYFTNRISFDEFLAISDNIISTSACLASPLNKLPDDHPRYLELANKYDYLEVQGHIDEDQIAYNKRLLELHRKIGTPLIAGTDTHNASNYKAECRKLLMVRKNKSYGNEDKYDLTWKTYDELVDMFRMQGALPEEEYMRAIANTNVMADSVESFELDRSIKYPILYGSREEDSRQFVATIERKFQEKKDNGVIPPEQWDAFRAAIDEELRVFQKLKMDGFMLSMSELISWCKDNNLAIGTARGSVGGSRIAYVTDIIDLNPETWHTVFSRFCNEDRQEIGDIDIDCVDTDRPTIFQHMIDKFGECHTGRVASFGTIADLGFIDDAGGALRTLWEYEHCPEKREDIDKHRKYPFDPENPWKPSSLDRIKKEFEADREGTMSKYPKLFYYYNGLVGTKVSQSVHPAGMVISPLNLDDAYGSFDKDGDRCLFLDMEELHEVGAAKYDFLVLKTVTVIRDTCRLIGRPYPKSHEIDWNDKDVWNDMLRNQTTIFQFESSFAADSYRKFGVQSIFDMSLVTACIRPSGSSYRDEVFARHTHKNPSPLIDKLLEKNLGWLIYQEDTIAFLQQICGLSGSEADNIRRAIGRKQKDRLDKAMPSILEGYCNKSDQPREIAEQEAKEFLQVIEDSASYQFGYNHSIAYCLLGYLCGYFRYHYPAQYITAFLNNAANDDDIMNGQELARLYGFTLMQPKFGYSRGEYSFNLDDKVISKGLSSVRYIGEKIANQVFEASQGQFESFTDVLTALHSKTEIDSRQLSILIHIDFFSEFGNQREIEAITGFYDTLADVKQLSRDKVDGTFIGEVVKKYASDKRKDGKPATRYTINDGETVQIIKECEQKMLSLHVSDYDVVAKVRNFADAMGYAGYVSGKPEDRPKLYVRDKFPLRKKKTGEICGYSINTQSIGSGKETRWVIWKRAWERNGPIEKGDVIFCKGWLPNGKDFELTSYRKIYPGDEEMEELLDDLSDR